MLFLLDAHEINTTEIMVIYKRAMFINVGHGVNYSEEIESLSLTLPVVIGNPVLSQKDIFHFLQGH